MVPAFYLKYAVFQLKMSSWVKSNPPILICLKRPKWSQNFNKLGPPQAEWIQHLPTWPKGCHDIFSILQESKKFGAQSFFVV